MFCRYLSSLAMMMSWVCPALVRAEKLMLIGRNLKGRKKDDFCFNSKQRSICNSTLPLKAHLNSNKCSDYFGKEKKIELLLIPINFQKDASVESQVLLPWFKLPLLKRSLFCVSTLVNKTLK